MAEGVLLAREARVAEAVRRYAATKEAAGEAFALEAAQTEFFDLLGHFRAEKEQAERLRKRGCTVAVPRATAVAGVVRSLLADVERDPGAIRERAVAERAVRQYLTSYSSEVRDATRGYVQSARAGVEQGLVLALRTAGLDTPASRLSAALNTLTAATQNLPYSEAGLRAVDDASAELRAVISGLDARHERLLGFVRRLFDCGGALPLADLDCDELDELKRAGVASNFVIRLRG